MPITGNFLTLLAILFPFVLAALGIGLMISARAHTREEAGQKVIGTVLPAVFLSIHVGAGWGAHREAGKHQGIGKARHRLIIQHDGL